MKVDTKHFAKIYLNRFINPVEQYEQIPLVITNGWIHWLYDQWNAGLITLTEFRKLLGVDISKYVGKAL